MVFVSAAACPDRSRSCVSLFLAVPAGVVDGGPGLVCRFIWLADGGVASDCMPRLMPLSLAGAGFTIGDGSGRQEDGSSDDQGFLISPLSGSR
jgi:hypothetical protein